MRAFCTKLFYQIAYDTTQFSTFEIKNLGKYEKMLLQNIENYVDENNFVDGTKDIERKIPQNVCVPCKDIYTLPINIK